MKLLSIRAVEGRHLAFLDRDDRIWAARWAGWTDRATRSEEPTVVHDCQYYRDAIARGDIEEVS